MRRFFLNILLFLPLMAHAEHLFEMGVHGGIAGWSSKPVYVHPQVGFNGGVQLYYNYLSPYVIGFRTGLTIDAHNAGFGKVDYTDHYATIDVENQQMEIDYTIGKLSERYTSYSVGIPLQLAFSKNNFLCFVGAKAVFPIATSWSQTVHNAALSVNYPAYDNRVYESFPLAATRQFDMAQEGKIQLPKVQWWASAELSYKIPLNNWSRTYRSYIVVGAYFDYCFTKYTPSQSDAISLIMLSDTRDGFPLQRLLTPVMEANRMETKLITDCALFDAGIKISYAIAPYDASHRPTYPCRCYGVW